MAFSARAWIAAVATVALLAGATGCARDRVAWELDREIGHMTMAEAQERFGRPTRVMMMAEQAVWSYETKTVVGTSPEPAAPDQSGPFVGRAVQRQILLFFDTRGVLTRWQRF